MSANLFEKVVASGLIGTSILFIGFSFFRDKKSNKHDAFKVRQELLARHDTKMLYSTMSFFYLQGFKQDSLESFYNLRKIMEIEKPNIVALPISKHDYENKYLQAMKHPKYRAAMDKFLVHLRNEDDEAIKTMSQFDLKNLEKLYLIDQCHKAKKCKIVCGRRSTEEYKSLMEIYSKVEQQGGSKMTVDDVKVEDYTEEILKEMSPKMTFSILPEAPYKTIVGIVQPELLMATAEIWKKKFKQNYSHQVIEDNEVMEREKLLRESQGRPIY